MRLRLLFVLFISLFLLSSCKKYQPADQAFFMRSAGVFISKTSNGGSSSHKIVDLWLYVNGKYQGTYPVGNLMPVASKDKGVSVNIFPGIKRNGIADTRIFYPFLDFISFDTLVESGKTIERGFTFKYKTATQFPWTENFESGIGSTIKKSGIDEDFGPASAAESFEGKSYVISLSGTAIQARVESSGDGFILPTANADVFLEINYKCNTEFAVGLMDNNGGQATEALRINPQGEWNKIYIQLSSAVNNIISNKYKVYFEFIKREDDPETKQVFIDNIKLLYL